MNDIGYVGSAAAVVNMRHVECYHTTDGHISFHNDRWEKHTADFATCQACTNFRPDAPHPCDEDTVVVHALLKNSPSAMPNHAEGWGTHAGEINITAGCPKTFKCTTAFQRTLESGEYQSVPTGTLMVLCRIDGKH